MLWPAKLGGGCLGSGKQFWSWIALDDVLGAIYHCLSREELRGPINLVAPQALRNKEFTGILARVLHRPALLPAPAFALRTAMGEMADEMLLASTRVQPVRLGETNYEFRFERLEAALRYYLGKERLLSR
jgi:NAD dependent epimerase/dehydratase family enzyme